MPTVVLMFNKKTQITGLKIPAIIPLLSHQRKKKFKMGKKKKKKRANSCTWSDQKKVLFGTTVTSYHTGAVQQLNLIFHRFVIKAQLPLDHMHVVLLHSYTLIIFSFYLLTLLASITALNCLLRFFQKLFNRKIKHQIHKFPMFWHQCCLKQVATPSSLSIRNVISQSRQTSNCWLILKNCSIHSFNLL